MSKRRNVNLLCDRCCVSCKLGNYTTASQIMSRKTTDERKGGVESLEAIFRRLRAWKAARPGCKMPCISLIKNRCAKSISCLDPCQKNCKTDFRLAPERKKLSLQKNCKKVINHVQNKKACHKSLSAILDLREKSMIKMRQTTFKGLCQLFTLLIYSVL